MRYYTHTHTRTRKTTICKKPDRKEVIKHDPKKFKNLFLVKNLLMVKDVKIVVISAKEWGYYLLGKCPRKLYIVL